MVKIKLGKSDLFAYVDKQDVAAVSNFKWYAQKGRNTTYAVANVNGKRVSMHRLILDAQPGDVVDHANGNGLDNRRSNIRGCTYSENNANRIIRSATASQYKGVCWHKRAKRWHARIIKDKQVFSLGLFDTERDAAIAYNAAAKVVFGKFANLNRVQ